MGTASYEYDDSLGSIYWQIMVQRDYNQSLNGYVIEDGVFNLLADKPEAITNLRITDFTNFRTLGENDYTIEGGRLTLNVDTSWIHIAYFTNVDNDGKSLSGQDDDGR